MNLTMLPIFLLSAGQISGDMILDLVDRKVPESRYLDYKSEFYGSTDSEKFKLLKHVSGFANSCGGLIIFGIEESNEIPTRIVGVDRDIDYLNKTERLIHECIDPTLEKVETAFINVGEKTVFVISISSENQKPYICSYRKSKGFYRRKGSDTLPMNRDEIKESFLSTESWHNKDPTRSYFFPSSNAEALNTKLLMESYNNSIESKNDEIQDKIIDYIKNSNSVTGKRESEFNCIYIDKDGLMKSNDKLRSYALSLAKANTYYRSSLEKIDKAIESTQLFMHFMSQVKESLTDDDVKYFIDDKLIKDKHDRDMYFQEIIETLERNLKDLSC